MRLARRLARRVTVQPSVDVDARPRGPSVKNDSISPCATTAVSPVCSWRGVVISPRGMRTFAHRRRQGLGLPSKRHPALLRVKGGQERKVIVAARPTRKGAEVRTVTSDVGKARKSGGCRCDGGFSHGSRGLRRRGWVRFRLASLAGAHSEVSPRLVCPQLTKEATSYWPIKPKIVSCHDAHYVLSFTPCDW